MLNTVKFTDFNKEKPIPEWIGNDFALIDEDGHYWLATFTRIDSAGYYFICENEQHGEIINPDQWACLHYE